MGLWKWTRAVLAGAIVASMSIIVELPLTWLWTLVTIIGLVVLVLRGNVRSFVGPLSFWYTAPLVLCVLGGSFFSLLVVPILFLAGKPLTLAYLVLLVMTVGLYQLFRTNRAIWFGLEDSVGAPAARRHYLLEESVLVDGRIVALAASNLWKGDVVVAGATLRDLERRLQDSTDDRAIRAKETLTQLSGQSRLKLRKLDTLPLPEEEAILNSKETVVMCTNTAEVAALRAQGREALALDEVAQIVSAIVELDEGTGQPRGKVLRAGEVVRLKLVKRGDQRGQAIGHLDDGTPVAVDEAEHLIGQRIEVRIRAIKQLKLGRMAFAEVAQVQ